MADFNPLCMKYFTEKKDLFRLTEPRIAQESLSKEAYFHWGLEIFLSSFKCRRKTGVPGENLRKQVWTGNHLQTNRRDRVSNPGCNGAKRRKYRYTTCFPLERKSGLVIAYLKSKSGHEKYK